MGLVERAGPNFEEQPDGIAEAMCELADTTARSGWSAAADDVPVTVDTLTSALAEIAPDVSEVLVAVTAAIAVVRRRVSLPVDAEQEKESSTAAAGVPGPRTWHLPQRRGLGPGFQGIHRPAGHPVAFRRAPGRQ
ncbi:hypothetical protein [Streptomyces sp. NPDC088752]|uniref:hypothetical protein n=1 Tax=Streptomyces sp. NPDC088752 TaxID=3154963 RepID=UPI003449A31D